MRVLILASLGGLDERGRPYGYPAGSVVDVSEYIANDLVKHGHAEMTNAQINWPFARNTAIATAPEITRDQVITSVVKRKPKGDILPHPEKETGC